MSDFESSDFKAVWDDYLNFFASSSTKSGDVDRELIEPYLDRLIGTSNAQPAVSFMVLNLFLNSLSNSSRSTSSNNNDNNTTNTNSYSEAITQFFNWKCWDFFDTIYSYLLSNEDDDIALSEEKHFTNPKTQVVMEILPFLSKCIPPKELSLIAGQKLISLQSSFKPRNSNSRRDEGPDGGSDFYDDNDNTDSGHINKPSHSIKSYFSCMKVLLFCIQLSINRHRLISISQDPKFIISELSLASSVVENLVNSMIQCGLFKSTNQQGNSLSIDFDDKQDAMPSSAKPPSSNGMELKEPTFNWDQGAISLEHFLNMTLIFFDGIYFKQSQWSDCSTSIDGTDYASGQDIESIVLIGYLLKCLSLCNIAMISCGICHIRRDWYSDMFCHKIMTIVGSSSDNLSLCDVLYFPYRLRCRVADYYFDKSKSNNISHVIKKEGTGKSGSIFAQLEGLKSINSVSSKKKRISLDYTSKFVQYSLGGENDDIDEIGDETQDSGHIEIEGKAPSSRSKKADKDVDVGLGIDMDKVVLGRGDILSWYLVVDEDPNGDLSDDLINRASFEEISEAGYFKRGDAFDYCFVNKLSWSMTGVSLFAYTLLRNSLERTDDVARMAHEFRSEVHSDFPIFKIEDLGVVNSFNQVYSSRFITWALFPLLIQSIASATIKVDVGLRFLTLYECVLSRSLQEHSLTSHHTNQQRSVAKSHQLNSFSPGVFIPSLHKIEKSQVFTLLTHPCYEYENNAFSYIDLSTIGGIASSSFTHIKLVMMIFSTISKAQDTMNADESDALRKRAANSLKILLSSIEDLSRLFLVKTVVDSAQSEDEKVFMLDYALKIFVNSSKQIREGKIKVVPINTKQKVNYFIDISSNSSNSSSSCGGVDGSNGAASIAGGKEEISDADLMCNPGNNCPFFSYSVFHYLIDPAFNRFLYDSGGSGESDSEGASSEIANTNIDENVVSCILYIKTVVQILKGSMVKLLCEGGGVLDNIVRIYFHLMPVTSSSEVKEEEKSEVAAAEIAHAKRVAAAFIKYVHIKVKALDDKIKMKLANFVAGEKLVGRQSLHKSRLDMSLFYVDQLLEYLNELMDL